MALRHTPSGSQDPAHQQQLNEYLAGIRSALAALPSSAWVSTIRNTTRQLVNVLTDALTGSAWSQPTTAINILRELDQQLSQALTLQTAAITQISTHVGHHGGIADSQNAVWHGANPQLVPAIPEATLHELSRFVASCVKVLPPDALQEAANQVRLTQSRLAAATRALPPTTAMISTGLTTAQGILEQTRHHLTQAAAAVAKANQALSEYLTGALGRAQVDLRHTTTAPKKSTLHFADQEPDKQHQPNKSKALQPVHDVTNRDEDTSETENNSGQDAKPKDQ